MGGKGIEWKADVYSRDGLSLGNQRLVPHASLDILRGYAFVRQGCQNEAGTHHWLFNAEQEVGEEQLFLCLESPESPWISVPWRMASHFYRCLDPLLITGH